MQNKYRKITIILILMVFFGFSNSVLPQNNSLRIISLAPATTEILFALGLDEEIIAVSESCNYPEAAKTKQKTGTFSQPNIEKILSLKPDIVFCTGLEQAPAADKLKKLKLNVFVSDPKNISELFKSIREIGRLTNKEKEAIKLIESMEKRIEKVNKQSSTTTKEKKQKVFIEIWHSPLTTVGSSSFINEIIELAGGVNIMSDVKSAYVSVSQEVILKRNPDCIILAYMGDARSIAAVMKRPGWSRIAAVKNKRVYNDIHSDTLLRPGPRIVDALEELYKKLYPDG